MVFHAGPDKGYGFKSPPKYSSTFFGMYNFLLKTAYRRETLRRSQSAYGLLFFKERMSLDAAELLYIQMQWQRIYIVFEVD